MSTRRRARASEPLNMLKMEAKKKMIKIGDEEISEACYKKIENDAIEKYKMDMVKKLVKKEYQCFVCKILPSPGITSVKQCNYCSNIFCNNCTNHVCPIYNRNHSINANSSIIQIALTINLDVNKYMSYFCKNIRFGCEEVFASKAKLDEHEKYCDYQVVNCAMIDCMTEVCFLNYLDHFKEKHVNHEYLINGKIFQSPMDFKFLKDSMVCSAADCQKDQRKADNIQMYKTCQNCKKLFCCQGKSLARNAYNCGFHVCSATDGWLNASLTPGPSDKKWIPKKYTAFNKTFFEVGIVRNNFIYKWIYVLALPEEAKNYYFHAYVKDASGENVESYYRQARSLVESHEQVIEDENCVVMGVKSAKKLFKHGTEQVDFSMKIRNLKDEAKDEDDESGIDD